MQTINKPKLLLVGLGSVSRAVGARLVKASRCQLVGAVDLSPDLDGVELSSIVPGADPDARVSSSLDDMPDADIAFLATTSFLDEVAPICDALLDRDMNVVSICEELGFGQSDRGSAASRLDGRARELGLTILGTGCNPGMLQDTLPLLLSSLTWDVTSVVIHRTADMSGYGGILSKFGFGLNPSEFNAALESGSVIGHIGFRESIAALAHGLGWKLDEIIVSAPQSVLLAERPRSTSHRTVSAGTVAVVRHAARGIIDKRSVIDITIDFGIFEVGDPFPEGDSWRIESESQTIEISSGRIDSYESTVAIAANVAPSLMDLRPGLLTMSDLPVTKFVGSAACGERHSTLHSSIF